MKFKHKDKVKIDSEFYGKIKGTIKSYSNYSTGIEYRVEFVKNAENYNVSFNESELSHINEDILKQDNLSNLQLNIFQKYLDGESFDAECPRNSGKTYSIMGIANFNKTKYKTVLIIVPNYNHKRFIIKELEISNFNQNGIFVVTKEESEGITMRGIRPDLILVDEQYGYDWKVLSKIIISEDLQRIHLYSNPEGLKHYKFE